MEANLDREREAFEQDPDDRRAFDVLQEHLFHSGDWDALASLYEKRLDAPGLVHDEEAKGSLLFRLGQVLEERCLEIERACEIYWQVSRDCQSFGPAIRQLRRIHAQRAQWDMVLQIAEIEGQTDMRPYERAAYLAEMGRVWLDALEDPDEAMRCFNEALAFDAHHSDALAGIARTCERLGRTAEAASTWEQLTEQLRGPDRAPAWVSLAQILEGPLEDPARATECYRNALVDDPRCEDAIEGLAARHRAAGQWNELAELFEQRFDLAAGARRRTAIATEAGRVHLDHTGNIQAARLWLDRGREMSDDDPELYRAVVDLERQSGNRDALRDAVARVVTHSEEEPPPELLLEAAELESERGSDDAVLSHLQRAEAAAPEDPRVLGKLSLQLERMGRSAELAEVLERRSALMISEDDTEERRSLLTELGRLYENAIDDTPAAIDAFDRAYRIDPSSVEVCESLERLLQKQEDAPPLIAFLEHACEGGPASLRAGLSCTLGETLVASGGDTATATRAFETALELEPDSARAMRGLQQIANADGDEEAILRSYEREARICEEPERQSFLFHELSQRFEARDDLDAAMNWTLRWCRTRPDEREPLAAAVRIDEARGNEDSLLRSRQRLDPLLQGAEQAQNRCAIATLMAAREDESGAIASYESALESLPECLEALESLEPLYTRAGRTEALARVLRRLADLRPGDEACRIRERLATLLEEQLGDIEGAAAVLTQRLEHGPADAVVSERLEGLLERSGRYEELVVRLEERSRALAPSSEEACRLDLRRGEILLDQLSRFDDAAALFGSLRTRDAGAPAELGLERALRATGDSAALAALLGELADRDGDTARAAARRMERAGLLEEALSDLEAAREIYESLREDEQYGETACQRLEALHERCDDWGALRDQLAWRVGRGNEEVDFTLHQRLAAIERDRLGDRRRAAEHLEAAGRIDPACGINWRNLALLYQELDQPEDLLRAMENELDSCDEIEREITLRGRSARLCGESEERHARAAEHYERLLALEPGHTDAADFLLGYYERTGRDADMVRLLEEQLESETCGATLCEEDEWSAESEALVTGLRLRIASLRSEALDDPAGAIAILEPALATVGTRSAQVVEPLATLYRLAERPESLADLCRRAASEASDQDRPRWNRRLGDVLRELDRSAEAIEAYEAVQRDRPDHDTELALRDLYRSAGRAEPLVALLQREIETTAPPDQVPLRLELATMLESPLQRREEALDELARVLEIDPGQTAAFDRAISLSEELGRPQDGLALVTGRLAVPLPASLRAELLERAGRLLAGPLERPDDALLRLREALKLDPTRKSAYTAMRLVLEGLGRHEELLDVLYVESRGATPDERAQLFEKAAHLATAHLSSEASLPWLQRLRAERPEDPTVPARLAELHRSAGRSEALLRCLDDELALRDDAERRRAIHIERAELLEGALEAPGRAVAALEAARAEHGNDPEILASLERLYGKLGRTRDRVETLECWLAQAQSVPLTEALDRHELAATLWLSQLSDPERAVPHLLRAIELGERSAQPATRRVSLLRALCETLRAAGRFEAWARAAEAEIALLGEEDEGDRRRTLELQVELAELQATELARPSAARRTLTRLLDAHGEGDAAARDLLSAEQRERLECILLERLRIDRDDIALERRLDARMRDGRGNPGEWLELGQLRAERLHAPAAAAEAFQRVLERKRDDIAAIRGLRDAAQLLGDWGEVARSFELELARAPEDNQQRAMLWQALAEVRWHRLGVGDSAARAYREALSACPEDLEVLRALQALEETRKDFGVAAELYEREVEILGDDSAERRHEVWLRVAELARGPLGNDARAIDAYESADACKPLSPTQRHQLALLYLATDDQQRYTEVLAQWCDDPAAGSGPSDHLTLAEALDTMGREADALERAEAAAKRWNDHAPAWEMVAALRERRGDAAGAGGALASAAAHLSDGEASERLLRGAELLDHRDDDEAAKLLRRAVKRDPANASAHAWLARTAERMEDFETASESAARALDLASSGTAIVADSLRFESALAGGRAARALAKNEAALLFYAAALEVDSRSPEALSARAELEIDAGDFAGARLALEARLEIGDEGPEHAAHLAWLGRCLEHDGETESALDRYREALALEPSRTDAHEGIFRILEAGDGRDEAIDALDRWIENENEADTRAELCVRAAALELEAQRPERSQSLLRQALEVAPAFEPAWRDLASLLEAQGDMETLRTVTESGLAVAPSVALEAQLARARGVALEHADDRELGRESADSYAMAARKDPRDCQSALDAARLLRGIGEWRPAADLLEAFAGAHPDPRDRALAMVHYKRGRLLAGPLESTDEALVCYERALELDPELSRAREPLARLLSLYPERWRAALSHYAWLLEQDPTNPAALRALLQMAESRGANGAASFGRALLCAIGSASPGEREAGPCELPQAIGTPTRMSTPLFEAARQLLLAAGEELAEGSPPQAEIPADETPLEGRWRESFGRLSNPAVARCTAAQSGKLIGELSKLAMGETDGVRPALSQALGLWGRRRLRKAIDGVDPHALSRIDFEQWRAELRVLAIAQCVDARDGDLRGALVALLREARGDEPAPERNVDLTPWLADCATARALLARVTTRWHESVAGER